MDPIRFTLTDGPAVTIRPAKTQDLAAIDAMHDRLSKQSLYYRYFAAHKPALSALREQMESARLHGLALVAALDGPPEEILGWVYCLRSQEAEDMAEAALLVEDRFQGRGLGRAMFDCLIQEAHSRAVQQLQLFILPDNQRMLQLLEREILLWERRYRDGMIEVQMHLNLQTA